MDKVTLRSEPTALTPNQVVAYNLARARQLRGWTQDEAAHELEPYLGERWSKATFSAAERSAAVTERVRQFDADDLLAFAAAFRVPLAWFFMPPGPTTVVATRGAVAARGPKPRTSVAHLWGAADLIDLIYNVDQEPRVASELRHRLDAAMDGLPDEAITEAQGKARRYARLQVQEAVAHIFDRVAVRADQLRELADLLEKAAREADVEEKL